LAQKRSDLGSLWLAPMVVAARMPILWFEAMSPNSSRRKETNLMVAEKMAAAQEGMIAAQAALGKAMVDNMTSVMLGKMPTETVRSTANAMMRAGLKPTAKRVRANAKRLMG
jgi:hypothetical protein